MFAVLLTARAGTGKDTVAAIFERRMGAINLKIARPLKDLCVSVLEDVFGIPREKATEFIEHDKNRPIFIATAHDRNLHRPHPCDLLSALFRFRFRDVEECKLLDAASDLWAQLDVPPTPPLPPSSSGEREGEEEGGGVHHPLHICGQDLTGRRLAQNLGTIFKERCGEDFWIRRACDEVVKISSGTAEQQQLLGRPIVVTDLRFPSEAEALRRTMDFFGIPNVVVRIRRKTRAPDRNACAETSDVSCHPSELSMDDIPVDAEIINDATSAEIFQEVAYAFISGLIEAAAKSNAGDAAATATTPDE